MRSSTAKIYEDKLCGKRRLEYYDASDSLRSYLGNDEEALSSNIQQISRTSEAPVPSPYRKFRRNKRSRIGYHQECILQSTANTIRSLDFDDAEPQATTDTSRNLCQLDNICQHFQQYLCNASQSSHKCFGYLESSEAFRHFIYSAVEQSNSAGKRQCSPTTLSHIVHEASHETLSYLDQLKIAHKLALAVLQYHATPWMRPQWELEDIGLFCSVADLDETALQTLHLSARFPKECQLQCHDSNQSADTKDMPCPIETDGRDQGTTSSCSCRKPSQCHCALDPLDHQSRLYEVDNLTLCNLGIALLQISHRKNLESLKSDRDPNNLYTARRLAYGRASPMTPRFQNIIRKCLRCDFNAGTDLESPELQSAVFSNVVCELEDMMSNVSLQ